MYKIPTVKLKDQEKETYTKDEVEIILTTSIQEIMGLVNILKKDAIQARLISYVTFSIAILLLLERLMS